eukprot:GHVS01070349.1.p1 GENE.GHVS01070349.1~~GHVS01070349.1.p1  ORF type:complete len:113 (+),score=16.84 GHVS01070349.1:179-517(+)
MCWHRYSSQLTKTTTAHRSNAAESIRLRGAEWTFDIQALRCSLHLLLVLLSMCINDYYCTFDSVCTFPPHNLITRDVIIYVSGLLAPLKCDGEPSVDTSGSFIRSQHQVVIE